MKKTSDANQGKIYWHDAFFDAIQLEFREYAGLLTFEAEHKLNEEALIMDVLIIKKKPDAVINKNIGRIFRQHNIVEFKSESDNLSIWDYSKVIGYAHIYSSFKKVPIEQITISFNVTPRPKKLFRYLQSTRNISISEISPGLSYICGEAFPVQVIENKKLAKNENLFLRILRSNLTPREMQEMLNSDEMHNPLILKGAFLNCVVNANKNAFKEAMNKMSVDVKKIILEHFEENGMLNEFIEKGKLEGKLETASEMLKRGFMLDEIAEITKMPAEWVQNLANQTVARPKG